MKTAFNKSFINHKDNGVYLKFPNGNAISTVWGFGNYCENYDVGEFRVKNTGSDNCEIYPECDEKTMKKIAKILPDLDTVAGYVTMEQWLQVIKVMSK